MGSREAIAREKGALAEAVGATGSVILNADDPFSKSIAQRTNANVIFAGTNDGPYRSTDGGDHWRKLNFPEPNVMIWSLSVHPTRPEVMYAGSAPIALYRSLA